MGLYNILFGTNPYAPLLKWILRLDCKDGYNTGRFRDIFVNEDGTKIVLFTRNGGGNRESHAKVIKWLQSHPNYIRDWDDEFDSTYAYFEFSVPKEPNAYLEFTRAIATGQPPKTVHERFSEVIKEVENMTPEQMEKDERFKPLVDILKKITELAEKGK